MYSIGTDIVSVKRIETILNKFGDKFLNKILNKDEQKIAIKIETIAGFWSGKEAVSKALGCGISSYCSFLDIEIKKNNLGAPYFILTDRVKNYFKIEESSISISHDGDFAISVAICNKRLDFS